MHIIALKTAADGQELPVEIQIRDAFMDRQAEFGVAGHWQYKMANHKLNAKHLKACTEEGFVDCVLKRRDADVNSVRVSET